MTKDKLATTDSAFAIQPAEVAEIAEIIAENVGDGGITADDLQRIKVPSGGGVFWEIPTSDGKPKPAEELECIILGKRNVRAYWETSMEEGGGGTPPDCYSLDNEVGIPNTENGPGGNCESCPFNQWQSANNGSGRGKACKERQLLMALLPGNHLPVVISVPPSSLKIMRQFMLSLANERLRYMQIVWRLGLEKVKNADSTDYAQIAPSKARVLDGEELAAIQQYADAVIPAFNKAASEIATEVE